MSKRDASIVYLFHDIEVDLSAERVVRNGVEVHLAPKVLKILELLLQSPNTLLTRQEIFSRVWPHQEVSDGTLSQAILTLRRALGGSEEMLKTVPRRGYMLCADIMSKPRPAEVAAARDVAENANSPIPIVAVPSSIANRHIWRNTLFFALLLGLLLYVSTQLFSATPLNVQRLRLEVNATDPGLAAAFRALVRAELDPAIAVISDTDTDSADSELRLDLETAEANPQQLHWRWHLSSGSKTQSGQQSSSLTELSPTMRSAFQPWLRLRDRQEQRDLPQQVFTTYAKAMKARSEDQWSQAKVLLQKALEAAPNNAILLFELANLTEEMGEPRVAILYYQRTLNTSTDSAQKALAQFKLAKLENNFQLALTSLAAVSFSQEEEQFQRTGLYIQMGHYEEASKLLAARARIGESALNSPRFAYQQGWLLSKTRQLKQAREVYQAALKDQKLTPYWRALLSNRLASVEYLDGNFKAAQQRILDALENFEPGVALDEQFATRRMLLNLRLQSSNSCYQGNEINQLKTLAFDQIGSVHAIAGYYSVAAHAKLNCGDFNDVLATETESIQLTRGEDNAHFQYSLMNRARVLIYLRKNILALQDLAELENTQPQIIVSHEVDYLRVRAGGVVKNPWVKDCFKAVRSGKSERVELAKTCLAQAEGNFYAPGGVLRELLQYLASGEAASLPTALIDALNSADEIDFDEWRAYCGIKPEASACQSVTRK
jgi:DNA-binding winged helix-turn-helix (wHTH) protein/tetratricopeptide (TPR) repeat protein